MYGFLSLLLLLPFLLCSAAPTGPTGANPPPGYVEEDRVAYPNELKFPHLPPPEDYVGKPKLDWQLHRLSFIHNQEGMFLWIDGHLFEITGLHHMDHRCMCQD